MNDNKELDSAQESKRTVDLKSEDEEVDDGYPPTKVRILAMIAIALAVFLIALDRTILGTAIPAITNEFNSFGDIALYEVGFLLPLCVLQLTFGRIYTFYPAKWIFITLVVIFEIGSLVCALAPTSNALVIGRVVTGIGGTGVTSGAFILINQLVPLESRPKYSGALGAVFGVASIAGPLLGGYLTAITWRWCFWINLPIGALSLLPLIFLTPKGKAAVKAAETFKGKVNQLDPIGFVLVATSTVSLILALQFGGVEYAWSDARIIVLFVLGGVFGIAFIAVQAWKKDEATVPPRIFFQRSIFSGCVASIGIGSVLVIYSLYLPVWFQAIQTKSPQSSGLSLLPLLLSNVLFVIIGGVLTSKIGYYTPFLIVGSAITIVGAGLITTWEVDIGPGKWIGYQVLAGVGLGLVLQQPNIAAQTVLPMEQAATGLTLLAFVQFFGGTIFTSVSPSLLTNKLRTGLTGITDGLDTSSLAGAGATSFLKQVPREQLPLVLSAYNDALRSIWYLALGLLFLVFVSSFGFEWKNVKTAEKKKAVTEA